MVENLNIVNLADIGDIANIGYIENIAKIANIASQGNIANIEALALLLVLKCLRPQKGCSRNRSVTAALRFDHLLLLSWLR